MTPGEFIAPPETVIAPYPALSATAGLAIIIIVTLTAMVLLRRYGGVGANVANPRFVLSLAVVVGFIGLTAYAARYSLPESEAGGQLLGALISAFTIVVSYWFRGGPGDGPRDDDKE